MNDELADVRTEIDDVRSDMRTGFGALVRGQERIMELLGQHIKECEKA